MENKVKNIRLLDLFKPIQLDDQRIESGIEVPDSIYQDLLTDVMERGHLAYTSEEEFLIPKKSGKRVLWSRIERLPLHPDNEQSSDLFYRWQSALATVHTWGYRLYFLLLRYKGETRLYVGTETVSQNVTANKALEQLNQAVRASLPGIGLRPITNTEHVTDEINMPLSTLEYAGAVTGIPSFRTNENNSQYQTLDQLAFGLRDIHGDDRNYALLVMADPLPDSEVSKLISNYRRLGSKIHTAVNQSVSVSDSSSESKKAAAGAAVGVLGRIADTLIFTSLKGVKTHFSEIGALLGIDKTVSLSSSTNISKQYLDKFAEYAEKVTVLNETRLNEGRNLGFWNAGVYILGETSSDVVSVTGLLRSIYSGKQTYLEPIRSHLFSRNSNARKIISQNNLIPCYQGETVDVDGFSPDAVHWHILGDYYQYISTPVNTQELCLITSLPRRDVPGVRFTRTAVRFANNPAPFTEDSFQLGHIVDMGVSQSSSYNIDVHSLVRHALIAGSTGSGKSTTCKKILENVIQRDIPVLIIEPAKDDYVRWALEQNKHLPPEKQFLIYMPGLTDPTEERDPAFRDLKLNPFQPASLPGHAVDLLSHSDTLTTILNASLPTSDVLPTIIDETINRMMVNFFGYVFQEQKMESMGDYPRLARLINVGKEILNERSYATEVRDNLMGCLQTRFSYLTRGMRGEVLNVNRSTDFAELFDRNVIVNVSEIGSTKDRALIMALLLLNLNEYRKAQYKEDPVYRSSAQKNRLQHLTLVEEAHNLLRKPAADVSGAGDPQTIVAEYFGNMLSEIRAYGEGFLVVDQVPTRLIEDATKNTNYKITHRLVAPDDCDVMAASMSLREDQKHILATLGIGNAIVYGDQDDAAAWVQVER